MRKLPQSSELFDGRKRLNMLPQRIGASVTFGAIMFSIVHNSYPGALMDPVIIIALVAIMAFVDRLVVKYFSSRK